MQAALHRLYVAEIDDEHQAPRRGVEHADMRRIVVRVLLHAGRKPGVAGRQRWIVEAVALQPLGARQLRGHVVGQAQAVILGLAAQDLGGQHVFVVLGNGQHGDRGQSAKQQAQQGRQQGEPLPQRQRATRAHGGATMR